VQPDGRVERIRALHGRMDRGRDGARRGVRQRPERRDALGRHHGGRLRIAERTTALPPAISTGIGQLLEPGGHDWPEQLLAHRQGCAHRYARVRPHLVVEVSATVSAVEQANHGPAERLGLR
jgi:hypothetical protein